MNACAVNRGLDKEFCGEASSVGKLHAERAYRVAAFLSAGRISMQTRQGRGGVQSAHCSPVDDDSIYVPTNVADETTVNGDRGDKQEWCR